ncbi:MAG: HEAT repeat domain-containing protein [Gammaproteobacteria bacterium]|nr:HEAT repeat domain-containing protein [Gammaproteobacteria bacterium]MBU1723009.1 HEAT repeat domain-containing protein [Gammaproteobacteria bacterium]MBU2003810.1 HEAT repeat domain-containing protein [Gammaproteobacteria bacterium]
MDGDIQNLINQLHVKNDDIRGPALASLIRLGAKAIPALRAAANDPDPAMRAKVMEALATIADPACADLFRHALDDTDGHVRAWGAQGLVRIKDPGAVEALLRTFHDYPDELHGQHTLSSYTLIGMGSKVLPEVIPLLADDNVYTRERAYWVVMGIVTRMPGYENGWEELAERLGGYDPHGALEERESAVSKWVKWAEQFE